MSSFPVHLFPWARPKLPQGRKRRRDRPYRLVREIKGRSVKLPGFFAPRSAVGDNAPSRTRRSSRPNSVDHHFELPRLRELARRSFPQILEAMLVPLVLFYAALWALGPTGAICAALAWNYLALLRRIWRRERLPGVLLIATLGLTARSVLALASGNSLFVYFLQPSLATALLGGPSCSPCLWAGPWPRSWLTISCPCRHGS